MPELIGFWRELTAGQVQHFAFLQVQILTGFVLLRETKTLFHCFWNYWELSGFDGLVQ